MPVEHARKGSADARFETLDGIDVYRIATIRDWNDCPCHVREAFTNRHERPRVTTHGKRKGLRRRKSGCVLPI
jgi:hypothetical protein